MKGIARAIADVVKLVKSLYGFREALKLWYATLAACFKTVGFVLYYVLSASSLYFTLTKGREKIIVLVYVDNLARFGNEIIIEYIKQNLREHFEITDMGVSKQFLGVSIEEEKMRLC